MRPMPGISAERDRELREQLMLGKSPIPLDNLVPVNEAAKKNTKKIKESK